MSSLTIHVAKSHLSAQALLENMTLVTTDPAFAQFGVKVLW